MKISLSSLIGILLIGGALALHFSQTSSTTKEEPKPEQLAKIYQRADLASLPPARDFSTESVAFAKAEKLVRHSSKALPAPRQQALLQALAILYRIQEENPAWETELVSRHIEQTIIAILATQGNL